MARRSFEVGFHIVGRLASSFSNAFASASTKTDRLRDSTRELKKEMRQLDQQYRRGAMSAQEYAAAHQRLSNQLERNIQKQQQLAALQQQYQQNHAAMTQFAQNAATRASIAMGTAAAASTAAAFSSVNKAMDFESQLSSIKAVTGLTAEEMEKMRSLALEVGSETKYSALEAAQGIEELLKAGISPAIVQADGLSAALNLATAGGLELAEAAEIMADGLNGFKKDGMKAADVANILAGAANASSTSVQEMKYGLSAVGPVADGIGVSFKEVNATLAAFSNNALKGSDAGTSLKTFLSNVQPSTDKAAELFKKYNLTLKDGQNVFFDTNGQLKDMSEVAEILRDRFKDLTDQQRSEVFFDLFGSDAVRAANILYKEGAAGIQKMYKEMSKVTALDVAKDKMDNASGAVEQMSGAFETLQIIAAEGTLPVIKKVALYAADMFENSTSSAEKASVKIGKAMDRIFAPFTIKPEFDAERKNDPEYMKQYQEQLQKYLQFKDMDFSEKVIYSLDAATAEIEKWVDGPGGEKVEKIFTKLAGIAANAWWESLKGLVSSSASQLLQGNVANAAGLGVLAYMLGGGLLARGAIGLGKTVKALYDTRSGRTATGNTNPPTNNKKPARIPPEAPASRTVPTSGGSSRPSRRPVGSSSGRRPPRTSPSVQARTATEQLTRSSGVLSRVGSNMGKVLTTTGKVVSKAALPATLALEAYNIYKSKDKVKASVQAGGGIAGGLGGAKLGAAIGTAIAPGIGTAIGGLLGGIGGFVAGKWIAGKATDAVRASAQQPSAQIDNVSGQGVNASMSALKASLDSATKNFQLLTMYAGQACGWVASLFPVQSAASGVAHNLTLLTMYAGQASGWLAALYPIQGQSAGIVNNLSLLTMYAGQASGYLASLYPIQGHASGIINNLSLLMMYTGQASGWIASLYPVQAQAGNVVHNLSLLTMYVGQASGWIASLSPIQAHGRNVAHNLSLLTSYAGRASGWVASLNGIQDRAAAVKSALSRLASRIDATPAPRVSVSAAASSNRNVKKYARGGRITTPHLGLVGEDGPEWIIPDKPNDKRSLSLLQRANQSLSGGLMAKVNNLSLPSGQTIHITYAPTIHGVDKREIEPVLKEERNNLERDLLNLKHRRRRLSFG